MAQRFFVGSYAPAQRQGVHLCRLSGGAPMVESGISGIERPSYLAQSGDGKNLYAVSETETGAAVYAFALAHGKPTLLNCLPAGAAPCHLSVDEGKTRVAVASYLAGELALYRLGPDGGLLPGPLVARHRGRGPNAQRQEGPHVHCAVFAGGGRLLVADLGTDEVVAYDARADTLAPEAVIKLPPGAGPRHLLAGPGEVLYVLCELTSQIAVVDLRTGEVGQLVSTLPPGFTGKSEASAIRLDAGSQTLYAANRGHDSIACFTVLENGRKLLLSAAVPTAGKTPRDFHILDGHLVAACQDSDLVEVMPLENSVPQVGGRVMRLEKPACVIPFHA